MKFLLLIIHLTLAPVTIMAVPFLPSLSARFAETSASSMGEPTNDNEVESWQKNGGWVADSRLVIDFPAQITAAPQTVAPPPSSPGVLQVGGNGRFLVRSDGAPFFWLGDSAQLLLYRLSRESVDLYLRHRASLGFTVIQTQIVSFLGIDATNFYGDAPFINGDPRRPNESFWQHVDYVINRAVSLGLVLALVPDRNLIIVDQTTKNFGPLNASSAYEYGQYIGGRFRGKPIVWVLGWDIGPGKREDVFRAEADGIAQGAADGDHGKVLITFHPHPSTSSSKWFHNDTWLDFNSIQSGHMDNNEAHNFPETHSLIASDYAQIPSKPTLDNEPAYEDAQDGVWNATKGLRMGDDVIRRKAYWAVFAGAFGHTYGHNDLVAFHEPGRRPHSGQRNHWKDVLNAPGARHMRHLRTLLESRPHRARIPDQSLLAEAPGTGVDHVRATGASDGSYAFIYIPNGRSVNVNMENIAGQSVHASWFDPRTGAFSAIGQFCNAGIQSFDPPNGRLTGNDWVLVLDALWAAILPPFVSGMSGPTSGWTTSHERNSQSHPLECNGDEEASLSE